MAFKLDFAKLAARTPEEAEAARDRIQREFEESLRAIIAKRTEQIDALMLQVERLSDWEQKFVGDMHYAATTYGMGGMQGERLADLSTKQVNRLEQLHLQYCGKPVPASQPRL